MKKRIIKVLSLITAIVVLAVTLPVLTFAAPAADIPAQMLDNVYLDALAYTGYGVNTQKNDGTIFIKYASGAPASVLSGIGYGTGPSGLETVSSSGTATGLAPNLQVFKSSGLCCASYVSYVYYNYLPNIAGIDMSALPQPSNPRSAIAYNNSANEWVDTGKARRISFTQSANGSNFSASEGIPIGSLVVFKTIATGEIAHVAIYAGKYNGQDFVTHTGNSRGPEICTVSGMSKGGTPEAVVQIVVPAVVEANGVIEVRKKDTSGKNLSGAVFVATNNSTGVQYPIGPTDANGFAQTRERLPYGTYTVKETVFPKGYTKGDQTEWSVAVSAARQTVAVNAVNTLKKGKIVIEKTGEMFSSVKEENGCLQPVFAVKGLSGAVFDIIADENIVTPDSVVQVSKDTVVDTVTTDGNGRAESKELYLGKYRIEETNTPEGFLSDSEPKHTELKDAGGTAQIIFETVAIRNNRQKAQLELKKVMEIDPDYLIYDEDLSQVVFGLYANEDMTAVDGSVIPKDGLMVTAMPDKDGRVEFDCDLPVNSKVYVKEIRTGDRYVLSEKAFPVTVEYSPQSGSVVTVKANGEEPIVNLLRRGIIEVCKTDEKNNPLAGVVFGLFSPDCSEYISDNALQIFFTDETGICKFEDVPCGDWKVKELYGISGYIQSDEILDAVLAENGEVISLFSVNKRIYGSASIKKTDKDSGKALSGAEFTLIDENGDTKVGVTDIDGYLKFDNIPYGNYSITETKAPEGYERKDDPLNFRVETDGQTFEFDVTDVKKVKKDSPKTGDGATGHLPAVFAAAMIFTALFAVSLKKYKKGRVK